MILIGLSQAEKQKELDRYLQEHEIKKTYCFYYKDFPYKYEVTCEIEYIEYADIEMYKFFYRLLEEIDNDSLIVMDECMRTQNRSELTYNCAHHYLNQTHHKIIFEHFPIIDTEDDFMILLDFENKGKYRGKSFDYIYLKQEDIRVKPHLVKMDFFPVEISDADRQKYETKKEGLFDALGNKDPDTIPRALQLFAGNMKKKAVKQDHQYVARNKRFKLENVFAYEDIPGWGEYIVIDTHYRRLNMNDFLKRTGMEKIKYLCTSLSIDNVIIWEFAEWKARLDVIYAHANIYK
jgi:hypothetical protein